MVGGLMSLGGIIPMRDINDRKGYNPVADIIDILPVDHINVI